MMQSKLPAPKRLIALVSMATSLAACPGPESTAPDSAKSSPAATSGDESDGASSSVRSDSGVPAKDRVALFGDLHVHTGLSFDAYIFGTRSTPDAAYRYAKGEPLQHPAGFEMQLPRPLDFQAVTDHALYLGMLEKFFDAESGPGKHPAATQLRTARTPQEQAAAFVALTPYFRRPDAFGLEPGAEPFVDDLLDPEVVRSAWQQTIAAAEQHNRPGAFTTFIGFEYTSAGPATENLHRNVLFRDGRAPSVPFSSIDSRNPEDLWAWMDALRDEGIESLAIPHNANGSDGMMFDRTNWAGEAFDAEYALTRMRNEPLVEVTQVKGTSETHPLLSPNDEWAGFELTEVKVSTREPSRPQGSYVRRAYLDGLVLEATRGFNPYRFGLIGSSDTHVGAGAYEESNYWSKVGLNDATPQLRGSVPLKTNEKGNPVYAHNMYKTWGASGLTGVWAGKNTREALYAAFRRKETFATSGPRIRVRFFAGHGWDDQLVDAANAVQRAYAEGVPMGGDLSARSDEEPRFLAWAARDPASAALDRLQIVKGWTSNGRAFEKVFDIACSDGGQVDADTHRCPDNGARVRSSDCRPSPDRGANELRADWEDPEFDPGQHAFYYVRALENPTCRWSTWDALRAGVPPRTDLVKAIQERAWSSPIWIRPDSN